MRINGIEVVDCDGATVFGDDGLPIIPLGRYFLLRRSPEGREPDTYSLSKSPGRTNRSGEERASGWLGTNNNVGRYADGAVEIYPA